MIERWVQLKALISKLSAAVDVVAAVITCIVIASLCVLIFLAVMWRWILNNPIAWQYEATLVGFAWLIFIGMSMTFRTQEHMALTFVTNALNKNMRVYWLDAIDVFCIAFLAVGIVCSISVVQSSWPNYYMTIPVSRGIFYLPFPIGAAFSIVHLVDHILNRNAENVSGGDDGNTSIQEVS